MLDLLLDQCDGCKHFESETSGECGYCMRNSGLYPDYPDNYEPCEEVSENEKS